MCGISGIISKNKIEKNLIEHMTDTIIHRGPDGFGYHYDDKFVFGHRRLAIVDLSEAGHQPMHYKDRYVITFNGEVYNHLELRDELEKNGYNFKSNTDTEVIMASYDFWGIECLNKFNGMWAFVLYDKLENKYFMSRDRFGKKPFYYYKDESTFIFGSEIKVILAHPNIKAKSNLNFLNSYLDGDSKEYVKETAFENIFRFDCSSYFEGTEEELFCDFKQNKFWELKPNINYEKFDEKKAKEYAEQYYDLLEDAVKIRLRADVKVGSALSGGLDSSSIVYIVNKLLKEQNKEELQETFSSVYKSDGTQDYDESYFIDIMANKLKVHSNKIEPKEDDIPTEIQKMIWHLENPPENSLMSSWHTFKLVSTTSVKVTLDGQGADEQLAGYLGYINSYLISLSYVDFYKEIIGILKIPNTLKHIVFSFIFIHLKLILGKKNLNKILKYIFGNSYDINLNQRLKNDFDTVLNNLLHYSDSTSMAFSIESRAPFMDYRLVEYLASIPASYKLRNGWTKYIARLAFNGKLPDDITWRKDKMGWPIPEKIWFNGKFKNWYNSLINSVDTNNIKLNIDKKQANKAINIALWLKIFINKGK